MLEIHHSGREPSILTDDSQPLTSCKKTHTQINNSNCYSKQEQYWPPCRFQGTWSWHTLSQSHTEHPLSHRPAAVLGHNHTMEIKQLTSVAMSFHRHLRIPLDNCYRCSSSLTTQKWHTAVRISGKAVQMFCSASLFHNHIAFLLKLKHDKGSAAHK